MSPNVRRHPMCAPVTRHSKNPYHETDLRQLWNLKWLWKFLGVSLNEGALTRLDVIKFQQSTIGIQTATYDKPIAFTKDNYKYPPSIGPMFDKVQLWSWLQHKSNSLNAALFTTVRTAKHGSNYQSLSLTKNQLTDRIFLNYVYFFYHDYTLLHANFHQNADDKKRQRVTNQTNMDVNLWEVVEYFRTYEGKAQNCQ